MADKKTPRNYIVTPAGKSRWAKLLTPDTKFVKTGEFKIDLVLTGPEAEELKAKIDAVVKPAYEAFKKENPKKKAYGCHLPYTADLDDNGDETGATVFRFKSKAHVEGKNGKAGFDRVIKIFNAKKAEITGVEPGNGSTVKVSGEIATFSNDATKQFGGTLRLNAVQILKLVERGGGDFGFGEEEGDELASREAAAEGAGESAGGEVAEAGGGEGSDNNGDF